MKVQMISIIGLLLLGGCSPATTDKQGSENHRQVEAADSTADFLQMTHGRDGNVLAWWIETDPGSDEKRVCFSKSPGDELDFVDKQCIGETKGLSTHPEGLPTLLAKPGGDYVLVFERPNKDSEAQFAGSVLYIQSPNGGESWSEPQIVHSDRNRDNSHAFATAVLLPDGEVGAAWLDGRNHLDHSEVYFARTRGEDGFSGDRPIGGPSCQCCKLSLYVDEAQNLHLAYRSLTGDNIRDISRIVSTDSGQSFSSPATVNDDRWQINACPHNGPDITESANHLFAIWYTMGGEEGLYYARSEANGNFTSRKRLTKQAKRPYIASAGEQIIAVWDEVYQEKEDFYRRVKMGRIDHGGNLISTRYLSPKGVEGQMPSALERGDEGVIISWTQSEEAGNRLYFQEISQ